jgi:hypothetical protein
VKPDAPAVGALPPPGWIYDPTTMQTRWWDGARWTEHVLPTAPTETAVFGFNGRAPTDPTAVNGPAKASLILILILALGFLAALGLGFAAGAAGMPAWQLADVIAVAGVVEIFLTVAAFVLAIIGTVVAVRRPTRKREAVFALVFSSLLILWTVARIVTSFAVIGTL